MKDSKVQWSRQSLLVCTKTRLFDTQQSAKSAKVRRCDTPEPDGFRIKIKDLTNQICCGIYSSAGLIA